MLSQAVCCKWQVDHFGLCSVVQEYALSCLVIIPADDGERDHAIEAERFHTCRYPPYGFTVDSNIATNRRIAAQ